jgi:hypothetical protein
MHVVSDGTIAKPSKTATMSCRKMLRRGRNARGKTEKNAAHRIGVHGRRNLRRCLVGDASSVAKECAERARERAGAPAFDRMQSSSTTTDGADLARSWRTQRTS